MCRQLRDKGEFTVGNQLGEERSYNPFIRCFGADKQTKEYYKTICDEKDEERVFAKLRALKDTF